MSAALLWPSSGFTVDDGPVAILIASFWRYHLAMTPPPIRQPVRIIGIDPGLRRTGWGVIESAVSYTHLTLPTIYSV